MKLKSRLSTFLNDSTKNYPLVYIIAAGLYPFLHYYNSNLAIADSVKQCTMLVFVCFIVPIVVWLISKMLIKLKPFTFFRNSYVSILNLATFSVLLGILIFRLHNKALLLLLIIAAIIGMLLAKHLKKIIILQLLLAVISFFAFIPKAWFALQQDNNHWALVSKPMLEAKLSHKPNIFVIQPDGYVNSKELSIPPYSYDNSGFETWLQQKLFTNYDNFRSNYYSTLSSNSSMFAMKHHYYSNTNKKTLKTHNANDVIVGNQNNVIKILKNNQYRTHLFTDNSFFLANRRDVFYDYCNVPENELHYFVTGTIKGLDILADLSKTLDTLTKTGNFFFIEKTTPSHITHSKHKAKGVEQERIDYLERLEFTNEWLKNLVDEIHQFDSDALIVIVADHGGYVGLEYTMEVLDRRLKPTEVTSSFSSILSIKWPQKIEHQRLNFKTNVNLFHTIFYALSGDTVFIENLQKDTSYLPIIENGKTFYYECLDENKNSVFKPIGSLQ